jgi:hypothetical protein
MRGIWFSVGPFVYNIIMQECFFFLSRHSYKSILLYKMHYRHVTFKYTLSGLLSKCQILLNWIDLIFSDLIKWSCSYSPSHCKQKWGGHCVYLMTHWVDPHNVLISSAMSVVHSESNNFNLLPAGLWLPPGWWLPPSGLVAPSLWLDVPCCGRSRLLSASETIERKGHQIKYGPWWHLPHALMKEIPLNFLGWRSCVLPVIKVVLKSNKNGNLMKTNLIFRLKISVYFINQWNKKKCHFGEVGYGFISQPVKPC